jgi:hypothetical protein
MSKTAALKPMSPLQRRVTQAMALSAACAAAWYFGVRPLEARAARATEDLAAQMQKVTSGAAVVAEQSGSKAKLFRVKQYLDLSREWTNPAANSTELYDDLVQLANDLNVRLDRIDPVGSPRPVAGASATAGLSAGATGPQGRRGAIVTGAAGELQRGGYTADLTGFRFGATGSYTDVLKFIHAVQHDMGATRIGQLRISPSATDAGQVELTLESWHMRLIEPKVATAGSNGTPGLDTMVVPAGPPPLMRDGGPN